MTMKTASSLLSALAFLQCVLLHATAKVPPGNTLSAMRTNDGSVACSDGVTILDETGSAYNQGYQVDGTGTGQDLECIWTLDVGLDKKLNLIFDDFELFENAFNYVRVKHPNASVIGEYSTTSPPPALIQSDYSGLTVVLSTDSNGLNGIKFSWSAWTPCPDLECKNGGQCVVNDSSSTCNCSNTGYIGATCETMDLCSPSPCNNSGVCSNTPDGDYACACTVGYSGKDCVENNTGCVPNNPCVRGRCRRGRGNRGNYRCKCIRGWKGRKCNIKRGRRG